MSTAASTNQRSKLPGHHMVLGETEKLRLDSGIEFGPFTIAYQTYGELNAD
jgi:homoserine O-acetyltransferase